VRGYVSAYDAETGELVGRTYTVPGEPWDGHVNAWMAEAAKTWSGDWWQAGGGGTAWDAIVYDPELDLVYIGVGNGSPWYRRLRSPGGGDNLYSSISSSARPTDPTSGTTGLAMTTGTSAQPPSGGRHRGRERR
jgi:glucose dehydrogenase